MKPNILLPNAVLAAIALTFFGITANAKAEDKVTLKVIKVDSEETAGEDGKAANAVDGDTATLWHTQWQDANPEHPHEIIIELSQPCKLSGFTYLPRQDESENGSIKDYEFYLSNDGDDFGQPVKKGTFENTKEKKTATFDAKQCRFIKLKALSEVNDQAWTSAAEIGIIETASASTPSAGDYIKVEIKGTLETGLMAIGGETTGTVIRVNDVTWELDFGGNKELKESATKLNKKTVLLTGTYQKIKGVEIRERHIIKVATLNPAGDN
jgi:F5/8 type C domain